MKVLHLIDHLGVGGAQALMLNQIEVRSPKIEATVWSLRNVEQPTAVERLHSARAPYRTLGLSKRNPLGWFRLRRQLAVEDPDLINTRLDYSNAAGIAAAFSLGSSRPLVVSHIDNDPKLHYDRFTRTIIRRFASKVDAFVAISDSIRCVTETEFPEARRIEVIPPGIDLRRFTPDRIEVAEVERLRAGATRVIGTVGRLDDQKSFDVLLHATPTLVAEEPSTRVLIVGDGPRRGDLELQTRRLGIEHAVDFAGYRSDVATVYGAMDLFALPSRHEGFGLVFVEAMAMGVPVVGTRVVGSIDAVEDGVTGLLVEHGDPAALASAISRLFRETDLRRALVANGQDRVQREWSRETLARRTEALYLELFRERSER